MVLRCRKSLPTEKAHSRLRPSRLLALLAGIDTLGCPGERPPDHGNGDRRPGSGRTLAPVMRDPVTRHVECPAMLARGWRRDPAASALLRLQRGLDLDDELDLLA